MRYLASCLFLFAVSASAQVKVCVDAKGKKTFTDYDCAKIGMKSDAVIQDINITPKQCGAIKDAITNSQNSLARHDAEIVNVVVPGGSMLRNVLVNQLEANQLRYHRECVR
ncbi:hypothetical protein ACIQW9_04560 [Herminiimonas sp. NPDC097707]|uniref:hypothetical protein n=1 Tax=Herminiimonas sp. NPDC097707 TaxID=3364007 RepID=UPI00383B6ABC